MFAAAATITLGSGGARADDYTVTVGMILPMTGQQASTSKQERASAEIYIQQHGDTVAGKKIVVEVKDDTGAADVTKRLAEELIGNDHAKVLIGFGLTPLVLATAPVATEAGSGDCERRRDCDDHREIALYRAHLVHPSAGVEADGRVGGQEWDRESRHRRRRL